MPDAKVAILNIVPVDRTGAPQKDVIEYIEGLLARARTGELQSIAVAYAVSGGAAGQGAAYGKCPGDHFIIAGALLMAQHELAHEMSATSKDAPPPPEEPA